MKIKIEELKRIVLEALFVNYPKDEANRICDVVMFGQMSGKLTHGINRLVGGGEKSILHQKSDKEIVVSKETSVSILLDGQGHPGLSVLPLALEMAMKKIENTGLVLLGTRGTYNTSGCLSYFLEKIASNNLVGIIMSRASKDIAPFGAVESVFGTNPIGFAIPGKPRPFIFDMATSTISYGGLMKAKAEGKQIGENMAIDSLGNVTTDPQKVMDGGAILPFDRSYKGSGLAMIVEILAGCLVGAGFSDIKEDNNWGNLVILFKPDLLTDLESLKESVNQLIKRTKEAKRIDGGETRVPGETTLKKYEEALLSGEVEIDETIFNKLNEFIKLK